MADTFVTKISGNPIAAALAARDADGNQIDTTYAKGSGMTAKKLVYATAGNTIATDSNISVDGNGNVTIGGNLTVNGTTTTISTTNMAINDKMITLAQGNTAALTSLAGIRAAKADGSQDGILAVDSAGNAYAGLIANSTEDSKVTSSTSGLYKLAKNSDVTTLQTDVSTLKGYFTGDGSFNYSGIETASANVYRTVWFSHAERAGTPVINPNFKYNPSTAVLTLNEGSGSVKANLNGRVISDYASGTWINSASNATVTCNYTSYGGIFCAPTKSGRVSMSTYPASDNNVYLNYFTASQISSGANAANNQIYWDAAANKLYTKGIDVRDSSITNLAVGGGLYWNPYVESSTDSSDAASITLLSSGAAGGTELRLKVANDASDVINLVTPQFIYMNSKCAFDVSDSWLRVNASSGFSSGIYTGSSLIRTDGALQVGESGKYLLANSSGTTVINGYAANYLYNKRGGSTAYKCLDESIDSYASIIKRIKASSPISITENTDASGNSLGTATIGLEEALSGSVSVSNTANGSLAAGGSFNVPSMTVDKYGRVTSITSEKMTLSSHTHSLSIVNSNDSNQISLIAGAKYKLTAGGSTYVFTMPSDKNDNTTYSLSSGETSNIVKLTDDNGKATTVTVNDVANAAKAGEFSSAATVKLTGDVTGEASSAKGWSVATTIADNAVTTAKIKDGAVTTAKINANAVTAAKLGNVITTGSASANGMTVSLSQTSSAGGLIIGLSGTATNATNATKATQDGSGNTITSTYVKKSGDTMTGKLTNSASIQSPTYYIGGTSQYMQYNSTTGCVEIIC